MKKVELAQGIIKYVFEPRFQQHFGNNIIALIDENKALLIDTGLEDQAKEVINDLNKGNILVDKVVISHFHMSHMQGLKILPGIAIYGSGHYKQTLDIWLPQEEHHYYTPNVLVEKKLTIKFGKHRIELIQNPGHSLCTILVKINEEFLYIADELIFGITGVPVLPRITKNDIINHYISVHNLNRYSQYTFIPGHGDIINQSCIDEEIKNVCRYLCEILSNDDKISVEEATQKCTCSFLHQEWHDNVYK